MLGNLDIQTIVARVIVLLIAFTVHELAHALTADYLGDPTPRRMGRITLNPLKHLDPFGTIMLIIAGFGWAKPVMVLAFFNLIPIPPLDGSKILYAILPSEFVYRLRSLEQFSFIILMAIVFFFPSVLNVLVVAPAQATLQLLLG